MLNAVPTRFAFGDETFRDPRPAVGQLGYYQLSAVLVEGADVEQFRDKVSGHGDASAQFKASAFADRGNRQAIADLLDLVCEAPCFNFVVVRSSHRISQERARQDCLETLLLELSHQKVFNITLDSREAVIGPDPEIRNKRDLETRRRLLRTGSISRNLRVTHRHDHDEHLLWVPDAVGWAYRRHTLVGDSALWERVEGVTQVITL